jgi:hypothetical protein
MFKTRQNWTSPLAEDCGDTEIARKKNQMGELFTSPWANESIYENARRSWSIPERNPVKN